MTTNARLTVVMTNASLTVASGDGPGLPCHTEVTKDEQVARDGGSAAGKLAAVPQVHDGDLVSFGGLYTVPEDSNFV